MGAGSFHHEVFILITSSHRLDGSGRFCGFGPPAPVYVAGLVVGWRWSFKFLGLVFLFVFLSSARRLASRFHFCSLTMTAALSNISTRPKKTKKLRPLSLSLSLFLRLFALQMLAWAHHPNRQKIQKPKSELKT